MKDLAASAVRILVDKRDAFGPKQMIAATSHNVMTPLTGLQLSIQLLQEELTALNPTQTELLSTASNCADSLISIFQSVFQRAESTVVVPKEQIGTIRTLSAFMDGLDKVRNSQGRIKVMFGGAISQPRSFFLFIL